MPAGEQGAFTIGSREHEATLADLPAGAQAMLNNPVTATLACANANGTIHHRGDNARDQNRRVGRGKTPPMRYSCVVVPPGSRPRRRGSRTAHSGSMFAGQSGLHRDVVGQLKDHFWSNCGNVGHAADEGGQSGDPIARLHLRPFGCRAYHSGDFASRHKGGFDLT